MVATQRVLYAVLNWGLGHATRSVPVIRALQKHGFEPVLASDGLSLAYLKDAFPHLETIALPALEVGYKKSVSQVWAMLGQTGKLLKWNAKENAHISKYLAEQKFVGIISDNRPSIQSASIPSVYITHQLKVKAGLATAMATRAHRTLYQKFTEIWVPDVAEEQSLAGSLSKSSMAEKTKYIGAISDLCRVDAAASFDCAVILSGPEPQRSLLEAEVIAQFSTQLELNIILYRGTKGQRPKGLPTHWQVKDLANRQEIQEAFTRSSAILARNGYSTLMDLQHFPKPAVLIPTPGQPEQAYLATLPIHQKKYALQTQGELNLVNGLLEAKQKFLEQDFEITPEPDWQSLFSLFKGE